MKHSWRSIWRMRPLYVVQVLTRVDGRGKRTFYGSAKQFNRKAGLHWKFRVAKFGMVPQ